MLYADIIIEISNEKLDRPFQYRIPEELEGKVLPGSLVKIPFGNGNRTIKGYVVNITDKPEIAEDRLKDIIEVLYADTSEKAVDNLIKLAGWMKEKYGGTMINSLRCVLPIKAPVRKRKTKEDIVPVENGYRKIELNEEQQSIVDSFDKAYKSGDRTPVLIHGITGSGKTEVYMEMIDLVIREGKQAIMLIPEISLTYQTMQRFYTRFGSRVSYLHSGLSKGERYERFLKAKNGETDIMIGPRSALFTPFPDTGIIVMDEEHDSSYHSGQMPKYNTRQAAEELARLTNAAFVMGSATPSLDAYYLAQSGKYRLLKLSNRVSDAKLPAVHIVDLRQELINGNRSIFSEKLKSLIEDRLSKKEQVMLFLNRRGYAGFVSCRRCGFVLKCPHCDVSLVSHRSGKMVCHYCGYETAQVKKCPSCTSKYIGGMRAGTEQVVEKLHETFKGVRTLRMDMDTTRKKGSYEKILSAFGEGKADILVGTQMIVKGHDFENVTLVGVLAADMSLFSQDYRAGERTFQLLTQASGRAGRSTKSGEVVIQTYSPENPVIIHSAAQDYEGFYKEEIAYRQLCGYPPSMHLMKVLVMDEDEERAADLTGRAVKKAEEKKVHIIGPSDDSVAKLNDIYRKSFYVKNADYNVLTGIKDDIEKMCESDEGTKGHIEFGFDD